MRLSDWVQQAKRSVIMSKTASKIAWILAGIGILMFLIGLSGIFGRYEGVALIGLFYVLPLAMLYHVIVSRDKRIKYLGIAVSLVLLAFVIVASFPTRVYFPIMQGSEFMPGGVVFDATVFAFGSGPAILLLITSVYSLIKKKK